MDWKIIVVAIMGCLIGFLCGMRFGKGRAETPSAAGFIDFVTMEDGHEQCVFKLKDDVDWIARQKYIIFQVRKGPPD